MYLTKDLNLNIKRFIRLKNKKINLWKQKIYLNNQYTNICLQQKTYKKDSTFSHHQIKTILIIVWLFALLLMTLFHLWSILCKIFIATLHFFGLVFVFLLFFHSFTFVFSIFFYLGVSFGTYLQLDILLTSLMNLVFRLINLVILHVYD